jgi:hypothetical protein
MEKLPLGRYIVEVKDENGVERQVIMFDNRNYDASFWVGRVSGETDKILVSVARFGQGFDMKIVDRQGKVLYKESQTIKTDFAKIYNLAKIKGDFSVIISDNNGNSRRYDF